MMKSNAHPEVWLRGKIEDVPDLLQPVAHALLQAGEDINQYTEDFPAEYLWHQPAGRASVAFHLQHITGVIDRMFTYAAGQSLSEIQFLALQNEGNQALPIHLHHVVNTLQEKITWAIARLKMMDENTLTQPRFVGRKNVPSTKIGLVFHAAEHVQRHVGQLLVTVSVLKQGN